MNVFVEGIRYLVIEPRGAWQRVGKDRKCSCGVAGCVHVQAVALYLKMGGRRAAEEIAPVGPLRTYWQQVLHMGASLEERRALHEATGTPHTIIAEKLIEVVRV